MAKRRIIKKILLSILLIFTITILTFAYLYFWPRYTFKTYGYHDIKVENDHGKWWLTFDGSSKPDYINDFSKRWNRIYPHIKKEYIRGTPYQLHIWHESKIKITKIEIMKLQKTVFSSDNLEQLLHKTMDGKDSISTICRNIELNEYDDYELVIYYSIKDNRVISQTIQEPLITDFTENTVSLFEMALGI